MAKFELPIYDPKTGDIVKTHTRNFMPVNLYIRFQKSAEQAGADKFKSDEEFVKSLQPLFLELFPEMTKEEYLNQTDIAEVIAVWGNVLNKSTEIASGDSKNG